MNESQWYGMAQEVETRLVDLTNRSTRKFLVPFVIWLKQESFIKDWSLSFASGFMFVTVYHFNGGASVVQVDFRDELQKIYPRKER
jgi:hypothetical protein